jgi:hypothetical protein
MTDILGPASVGAVTTRPGRSIVRGVTNTWFVDCTSPQAQDGTLCPADYFNDSLAQLRQTFTSSGIIQDNADDMLWRAIQTVGIRYGVDVGTAQALKCNFANPVLVLGLGPPPLVCLVKAANPAAGPSTFQANATAGQTLGWGDGAAIAPGDWNTGDQLLMIYNGATWDLISVGKRGASLSPAAGGCGQLSLSGGSLLLSRYNGSNLIVNGANMAIPSAGITLPVSGLNANTYYYIYAYSNAGVPTLAALTTGHAKATDGSEVCSSDSTRALVGAAYVNSLTQFSDTDGSRYTLSWFNRRLRRSRTQLASTIATGSASFIELSSAMRNFFINWQEEANLYALSGCMYATGGQCCVAGVGFDGITPLPEVGVGGTGAVGVNGYGSPGVWGAQMIAEGVTHYVTALGAVISGPGTAVFAGPAGTNPPSPITLNVVIRG